MSIDNFSIGTREEIVNASPWRTWEVCDNLWQGQEKEVPNVLSQFLATVTAYLCVPQVL
jgi:hypothetical protein